MTELLLKMLVIVVIGFILYLSFSTSKVKEGLTDLSSLMNNSSNSNSDSSSSSSSNGVAGNATAYQKAIMTNFTKLQDSMLIDKYKTEYGTILGQYSAYTQYLALNTLLNISEKEFNNNDITPSLEKFNTYMTSNKNIEEFRKLLG